MTWTTGFERTGVESSSELTVLGSQYLGACRSINPQGCEDLRQSLSVHKQLATICHHIFDLVKGLEEAHFHRPVLFSLGESAIVSFRPDSRGFLGQEHTDREGGFPVGRNIENILRGCSACDRGERRAFPHKVILVDVSLPPRVSLHSADGHKSVVTVRSSRRAAV